MARPSAHVLNKQQHNIANNDFFKTTEKRIFVKLIYIVVAVNLNLSFELTTGLEGHHGSCINLSLLTGLGVST